MKYIYFPTRFDRDTLSPFFDELDQNLKVDDICIDCTTLKYSCPTAMLVAGSKIREWITYRRENKLNTRKYGHEANSNVHSYLRHLGFFDFITMGGGNKVGEAQGSSSYLPITKIPKPKFDESTQDIEEWYSSIMSVVRGLARVVSGTVEDTQENRLYNYAFREVIRNVFEHSGANECYVCGQRWYNGHVEIAVIDEGVGIPDSLRSSFDVTTDSEALLQAIKPGISRTSNIDDSLNTYDNSGFGLYILSEIASSFGWFVLGSGQSRIIGYQGNTDVEDLCFKGTYFGMRLNKAPSQFSSLLDDIILVGEEEAKASGITKKASGMSKLAL
ncbi:MULTISPECIES: ATP-binding protein [unclassified Pseudoalteromonas]|uniref:ATP-binding protein n=1 Tax=unclassified Pseudoalteromonas TaxID=194690 RepID=UPI00110BD9A7|nr:MULTISPECIES: ATP-binding protein [unclassified Pseudoalteromonas]QLJ08641.1 sensor histidine kinase [Pseudoalteromonas sp. JSTW]TMO27812.1 ATP-binding protein [Pseudoalteromonas sp. S4741]